MKRVVKSAVDYNVDLVQDTFEQLVEILQNGLKLCETLDNNALTDKQEDASKQLIEGFKTLTETLNVYGKDVPGYKG